MSTRQNILSNTFFSFLDWTTIAIAGYIFWAIMGRTLPPADYGIVLTVLTFYTLLVSVLSLNPYDVFAKIIPQFKSEGRERRLGGPVGLVFGIGMSAIALAAAVAWIFAEQLSMAIYAGPMMAVGFRLLAAIMLTGFFYVFLRALLYGNQKMREVWLVDMLGAVIKVGVAAAGVMLSPGPVVAVMGWILGFLVAACLALKYAKLGDMVLSFGGPDNRYVLGYSWAAATSVVPTFLLVQSGIILLGFLTGIAETGLFGVAVLFGAVTSLVPTIIYAAIFPVMSELWSASKRQQLGRLVGLATKYTILLTAPFVMLLAALPEAATRLVYSINYLPAVTAVPPFVAGMLMWSVASIFLAVIYIAGRPQIRTWIITLGAVINVVLIWCLAGPMGANGVALAYMAATTVIVVASYFLASRLGLSFSFGLRKSVPALVTFGAACWFARSVYPDPVGTLLVIGVATVAYIIILFTTKALGIDEIRMVADLPHLGWAAPILDQLQVAIGRTEP